MKKTLLACCVLFSVSAQAAVLTLNNNNPSPGQYATFAAAQAAANNGDTILVHGSPISYPNLTVSKSLTIIGPGHKPKAPIANGVTFGVIDISASSVAIYGVKAQAIGGFSGVSNIIIENCFLQYVSVAVNGSNWLIKNNVFDDPGFGTSAVTLAGSNATGVIVTNNIINTTNSLAGFGGTASKLVSNNIFTWSGAGVAFSGSVNNTLFENNIFYGNTPNSGTQTGCTFNNNLTYLTSNNALPPAGQSGSGNQPDVNPMFVSIFTPPASSAFSYTYDYRLQPGSPGLGAGTGGTNLGVYESDNEFSMTGEPARPQTTVVTATPTSIPPGGTTQINFTIRKSTPNQ